MFFNKNKEKELKKPKVIHLEKYQPIFITTDGVKHQGKRYRWFDSDGLSCTVPQFIMISVKLDGYLEDEYDIVYPLQNIVSIKWQLIDTKVVLDSFCHEFEVVFSNERVAKMTEYNGE